MHAILEKITAGEATPADLSLLEELCDLVRNTALCGLGQSAPNPIITTLKYFREEYRSHIEGDGCAAGTCEGANKHKKTKEVAV
jgi:NADH:ubiquinone oxidoreductase subunit F (NADH-binding)